MAKGYIGNVNGVAEPLDKIYIGGENCAKNLLTNGALSSTTDGWDMQPSANLTGIYTQNFTEGGLQLTFCYAKGAEAGLMYANYQSLAKQVIGRTAADKKYIYMCAKVKGGKSSQNTYPLIYTHAYLNGTGSSARFDVRDIIDGTSFVNINDGAWHILSARLPTYDEATGNSYDFWRVAFGITPDKTNYDDEVTTKVSYGDTMYIKDFCFFDLTDIFGRGNEPTKAWCDANLVDAVTKMEVQGGRIVDRLVKKIYIGDENGLARLCYEG